MFVKKLLHLLAIISLSLCVTPFSTMTVVDFVCSLVFERISLIVFHVFLVSFLKRLKHNSNYVCFAVRMLLFKIPLYVLRLILIVL